MRTAKHVVLPRSLQLMHQATRQRVKLVFTHSFVRQSHVLLIEEKQRAMHLVTRGMIDPRVTLVTCRAVFRVRRLRHTPGSSNQLVLELRLTSEKTVERRLQQNRSDPLRQQGLPYAPGWEAGGAGGERCGSSIDLKYGSAVIRGKWSIRGAPLASSG